MEKHPVIKDVLNRLAVDLGDVFVVMDHWNDDQMAAAVASPHDPSQLVYFCLSDLEDALFGFELESFPANPLSRIYDLVDHGTGITYEQLREIARKHLEDAAPERPTNIG